MTKCESNNREFLLFDSHTDCLEAIDEIILYIIIFAKTTPTNLLQTGMSLSGLLRLMKLEEFKTLDLQFLNK